MIQYYVCGQNSITIWHSKKSDSVSTVHLDMHVMIQCDICEGVFVCFFFGGVQPPVYAPGENSEDG